MRRIRLEFPILLYKDDGHWVAHSLLTSTVAVHRTDKMQALREVCELLDSEIEEALAAAHGNLQAALDAVTAPAPHEMWGAFWTRGRHIDTSICKPQEINKNRLTFAPRDVGGRLAFAHH